MTEHLNLIIAILLLLAYGIFVIKMLYKKYPINRTRLLKAEIQFHKIKIKGENMFVNMESDQKVAVTLTFGDDSNNPTDIDTLTLSSSDSDTVTVDQEAVHVEEGVYRFYIYGVQGIEGTAEVKAEATSGDNVITWVVPVTTRPNEAVGVAATIGEPEEQ